MLLNWRRSTGDWWRDWRRPMSPGKLTSTWQILCYQMKFFKVWHQHKMYLVYWFILHLFIALFRLKNKKLSLSQSLTVLLFHPSLRPSQRRSLVPFAQQNTLLVSWDVSWSIWSPVWGSTMSYRRARHSSSKTSLKKSASTASLSGQCWLLITSSFSLNSPQTRAVDGTVALNWSCTHSVSWSFTFPVAQSVPRSLVPSFFSSSFLLTLSPPHIFIIFNHTLPVPNSDSGSCPLCLSDQVLCRAVAVVTSNSGNSRHRRLLSCYSHR